MTRWLSELDAAFDLLLNEAGLPPPVHEASEIRCERVWMTMRDGTRLATDIYFPPVLPAPSIATRTPYGRAADRTAGALLALARRGYVVLSQDCRGTGASEPDRWDYYMFEGEDGYDFVEWVSSQAWFDGFLGACGGSYPGQTQWCMATHPKMTTIVPEVSGLGVAVNHAHVHMLVNAYARSVGKGEGKIALPYTQLERVIHTETLAGGFFNAPIATSAQRASAGDLWKRYCAMTGAERVRFIEETLKAGQVSVLEVECLSDLFGPTVAHDAHKLPSPDHAALARRIKAPPLMITGWYDWGLNDALATFALLQTDALPAVQAQSRIIITPAAHNVPGYLEGIASHPELRSNHRTVNQLGLLLKWYEAVRRDAVGAWPKVIYYLMGANRWCVAGSWPPPETTITPLYLQADGALGPMPSGAQSDASCYRYDPNDPTPTVGGSVLSSIYPPGSVDVSGVQRRSDVLSFTTPPLLSDLDIAGPLRMTLFASSSAIDTDFVVRLSDVFPDGRAIQLQSGLLRARYRDLENPAPLEPGRVYAFEVDMWATANRFHGGHRLRVDISSADFPRFDRNSNRGGEPGSPIAADQTIWHDRVRPSRLHLPVLGPAPRFDEHGA